jgi:hypothetical protein
MTYILSPIYLLMTFFKIIYSGATVHSRCCREGLQEPLGAFLIVCHELSSIPVTFLESTWVLLQGCQPHQRLSPARYCFFWGGGRL